MKDTLINFLRSLLSRKFILAVATAVIAYDAAMMDGVMEAGELVTVVSPILAFIGIEGFADIKSRQAGTVKVK